MVNVLSRTISTLNTQLLVIGVFLEDANSFSISNLGIRINDENMIQRIISTDEFKGNFCSMNLIRIDNDQRIKSILIVGLGKKDEFTNESTRIIMGKIVAKVKEHAICKFALIPFTNLDEESVSSIVEGIQLSNYTFTKYKKIQELNKCELAEVQVISTIEPNEMNKWIHRALIISNAVNLVRDISNLPPNFCSPSDLAKLAVESCDKVTNIRVIGKEQMKDLGLNAIISVGNGSENEPKLIIIEYLGGKDEKPVILVGKAVTFDTGGISIKPSDRLDEMKFDKCGGCDVIGIMKAISELNLKANVIGIIPSVENMASGTAYRPGDIIKMFDGTTVEVLNTDAEGRLILSDALAYALKTYSPRAILDIATLTGAAIIALGTNVGALFGNDNKLVEKIVNASIRTGEKIWRLPIFDEHKEQLKSSIADIKNIGGRPAGAITAACFLSHFVGSTSWAHLDIAGPAWTQDGTCEKSYNPKGATGFGIRTLIQLIIEQTF